MSTCTPPCLPAGLLPSRDQRPLQCRATNEACCLRAHSNPISFIRFSAHWGQWQSWTPHQLALLIGGIRAMGCSLGWMIMALRAGQMSPTVPRSASLTPMPGVGSAACVHAPRSEQRQTTLTACELPQHCRQLPVHSSPLHLPVRTAMWSLSLCALNQCDCCNHSQQTSLNHLQGFERPDQTVFDLSMEYSDDDVLLDWEQYTGDLRQHLACAHASVWLSASGSALPPVLLRTAWPMSA